MSEGEKIERENVIEGKGEARMDEEKENPETKEDKEKKNMTKEIENTGKEDNERNEMEDEEIGNKNFTDSIEKIAIDSNPLENYKNTKINSNLSVREYLDTKVLPVLFPALSYLAQEKPNKPIEALAHYLLKHAKE